VDGLALHMKKERNKIIKDMVIPRAIIPNVVRRA
jgi:hypothetical protein